MRTEIKPLTGLRGIAATLVMIYHYGRPFEMNGVTTHFHLRQGYIAVDCFYILSGFVLALSYGKWFKDRFDLGRFGAFMLRRVARLYPAYLAIGAIVFLKTVINVSGNGALDHYKAYDIILNVLMMTGMGLNVYPVIGDSWSVGAEMVAYFFFPVLVFFAVFSRSVVSVLIFCLAVAGLVAVAHSGLGKEGALDVVDAASTYPMLRCVSGFTIGLVLFRFSEATASLSVLATDLLCGFATLGVALAWIMHAPDLFFFACLVVLVYALSFNGSIANRLFGNRPVHYLGDISYSLYLIHPTFISVAVALTLRAEVRTGTHWLYPVFAILFMLLSVKLAEYSARYIEIPARRWAMSSATRLKSRLASPAKAA